MLSLNSLVPMLTIFIQPDAIQTVKCQENIVLKRHRSWVNNVIMEPSITVAEAGSRKLEKKKKKKKKKPFLADTVENYVFNFTGTQVE